jgi:hypothetical protein
MFGRKNNFAAQGYTTGFTSTATFQAATPDYGQQPGAGGNAEMASGGLAVGQAPMFQSPPPPQQDLFAAPAAGAASL